MVRDLSVFAFGFWLVDAMYGFCGSSNSYIPCIPLAAAVTAIGRTFLLHASVFCFSCKCMIVAGELIMKTKELIETKFTAPSCTPVVIYGYAMFHVEHKHTHPTCLFVFSCSDTDSVMVNFNLPDGSSQSIQRAMELGKQAASFVTSKYPRPIQLEFEKVCVVFTCSLFRL